MGNYANQPRTIMEHATIETTTTTVDNDLMINALQAAVYLAAVIAVIADVFIWRP